MFNSKIILITGGSGGIGKTTAILFAQKGADIVITYKDNKDGADEVVNKIKELGQKAIAIQANLINENEAKKVVEKAIEEFGKIDVLVNNAGRYIDGDEWNGASDIWVKSLGQNLVSVMNISKYVVEIFQKQNSGVMINIASHLGIKGDMFSLSYSAAKAGVINITQSYAKLLSPFGRANSVSPGATNAGYWLIAPKEELEAKLASRPNHKSKLNCNTEIEEINFDLWWDKIIISDKDSLFSRGDIIKEIANKDGGAHIDKEKKLSDEYAKLTRQNSVGWKVDYGEEKEDLPDVHLFTIRQIAYEVIISLGKTFPYLSTQFEDYNKHINIQ